MPPVIIAKDVFKCYPGFPPVLRGINIEVEPGEMTAIMGPSGCGKSTMLHIVGMLHAPDSGLLEILGVNVLSLNREKVADFRRGNMGFVMQASNLFEHSTVFENVEFPLIYENVPPQERWERVIRALELVNLSARVHYRSNRLSGGEQQRVAIARAMVNNPRILLADEPTGALDARTSVMIMENFRRLCHEGGVSMMMVTHDPKMADYCDSIYTLDDGILNNRRHQPTPFSSSSGNSFLKPPEPVERGALVSIRFPGENAENSATLARRIYKLGLLSRIYSLKKERFIGNPEGYSLPLAVRQVGFFKRLASYKALFINERGILSIRTLWKHLTNKFPGLSFFKMLPTLRIGAILASWGLQDNVEFFYGTNAKKAASAAWIAAELLRVPFAFSVTARDLSHHNNKWKIIAQNAAFIACPCQSVLNEVRRLLPDIPENRIILLRDAINLDVHTHDNDEHKNGPIQAMKIIVFNIAESPHGFKTLIHAVKLLLKNKIDFHISIYGSSTWQQRWSIKSRKFKKYISSQPTYDPDNLAELCAAADVLLQLAPEIKGGDLLLPDYVCQAMACSTPVILCGMTQGFNEIIKAGKNSLIANKDDPSTLAENIRILVENPEKRHSLGTHAAQDIKNLQNIEGQSKLFTELIIDACARSDNQKKISES